MMDHAIALLSEQKYYAVNLLACFLLSAALLLAHKIALTSRLRPYVSGVVEAAGTKVFVFALPVLATILVQAACAPVIGGDTGTYFGPALALAEGQGLSQVPWIRSQGMALFYGPIYWLLGKNATTGFQLVNGSMACFSAWLCFPIAKRLGLPTLLCLASVALTALSLSFMGRSVVLMTEMPVAFFTLLSLYLLLVFQERPSPVGLYGLSVSFLWLVLIRPENGLLALGAAAFAALVLWKASKQRPGRGIFPHVLLAVALIGLPLAWAAEQRRQAFGEWGLQSVTGTVLFSGIISFGQTHGFSPIEATNETLDDILSTVLASRPDGVRSKEELLETVGPNRIFDTYMALKGLSESETDKVLGQAAMTAIRRHPWQVLKLIVWKGYIYVFFDVKVRAFTGMLPSDAFPPGSMLPNKYTGGLVATIDETLTVIDNTHRENFEGIDINGASSETAVRLVRLWHAAAQGWMAATGLFWNHLVLFGLLIFASRALRSWPERVILLYILLKVFVPIMFGQGDQRFYLPGYPLLVIALCAALSWCDGWLLRTGQRVKNV